MTPNPGNLAGSDSERIQAAVDAAASTGGSVVIPARPPDATADRDYWLLDRAILLPAHTTLVLDNCRLKLANHCRDNIIRSANCGIGITDIATLCNIHIVGVGSAVLEGADHPRATGDAAKTLSNDAARIPGGPYPAASFGTDAGRSGENPKGDWRNIGVLLAQVEDFSLRNLTLKDAHSWAVSLERCSFGTVRDLSFSADGGRMIDGVFRTFLNQDGLDLRMGCHDITIENITGHTGDDLVALTAIPIAGMGAGTLSSHMVSGSEPHGESDHIQDVIIRNVRGNAGGHQLVRFLNTRGVRLSRIILDGVIDTGQREVMDRAVVVVGDSHPGWGGVTPLGDTYGFIIQNVQGRAKHLVEIRGSLCDSVLGNLINYNPDVEPVTYTSGKEHVRDVTVTNAITVRRSR